MAKAIPSADLILQIALLPPISRGAHLDGPRLQAERLAELWRTDGAVTLEAAFQLLDVAAIEGMLWRDFREIPDEIADEIADPRYWTFPDFETLLLPLLREQAWREVLAGRLLVEAIPVKGSGHRMLRPNDLQDLKADWQGSRLLRAGGQCAFVEVQVQPLTTAAAPARKWRKQPSAEDLEKAMETIAKEYLTGATPPFREIWDKLKTPFPEITRESARNALTDYARKPGMSWLKGRPGHNSKSKSPK